MENDPQTIGFPFQEPEPIRLKKKVQKRPKIGRAAKARTIAASASGFDSAVLTPDMVDIIQKAPGTGDGEPVSQDVVGGTDEDEGTASDRMLVANHDGCFYAYCYEGSNMGNALDLADQFHNAHFQPDVCSILTHFVLKVTQPIYFYFVVVRTLCRLAAAGTFENMSRADAINEWNDFVSKSRWMFRGVYMPLVVNSSVLAYILAGKDREQVSLTEVFLPFAFSAASLLASSAQFNLVSHEAADVDHLAVGQRLRELPLNEELLFKLTQMRLESFVGFASDHTCSAIRRKLVRDHDPEVVREVDLLCRLYRKINVAAHESLLRHFSRMRMCEPWILNDGAKRAAPLDFWNQFTSAYRKNFRDGALPLDVMAEQFLIGWPSQAGMLDKVAIGTRYLLHIAALVLACVAALAPDFVRDREINFRLPDNGWCQAVSVIFTFYAFSFQITLFYVVPWRMMSLMTDMANAYRIFESMLMGPKASSEQGVPCVGVGNVKDMAAWYELYSFFIASTQRRKFVAEVGLAVNVFIVFTMAGMLVWYTMDPNWKPGVFFCETLVVLISFLLFSLPPLLVGLRANMLRRRTVDLLWGHATESRAYLLCIQGKPEQASRVEELRDAIGLTESIAQRLRLDAALVLRIAGVELTVAQFTAIASLMSTAAAFALRYVDWQRILQKMTILGE
ncbi:unnamed protein product [Symbiodinium sp. CCMP2592]|nr:unnamed protein product [Symbiodinium sp. CCMP2592]